MKDLFTSKDIQEYVDDNNYQLTPAEEVVLISWTDKTLDEKIKLYQHYIDTYSEENFKPESVSINWMENDKECGFREMLTKVVDSYNQMLAGLSNSTGYVYSSDFNFEGFPCHPEAMFSSYDVAYEHLVRIKDGADTRGRKIHALIKKISVTDNPDEVEENTSYIILNNKLEITDILPSRKYREKFSIVLNESIYIHVPVPFKPGDIVVSKALRRDPIYGVYSEEPNIRENDPCLTSGYCDAFDMDTVIDVYDDKKHKYNRLSVPKLSLEYVDRLSSESIYDSLLLPSMIREGKADFMDLVLKQQK